MQPSRPVDRDVRGTSTQFPCTGKRSTGVHPAEVIHVREDWTVFDAVEGIHEMLQLYLCSWRYPEKQLVNDDTETSAGGITVVGKKYSRYRDTPLILP